jgi:drug/metabolite transporter (DMT)-like permease
MKYRILLIVGILVGACGQFGMKLGVDDLGGLDHFASIGALIAAMVTSPYIIAGMFCVGLSMLMWLTVISKLELSFACPFVSISYIAILIFSWLVLNENISAIRVGGVGLIMFGVVLISRTGGEA